MATWDGSYSEDPNYFACPDQNASSVAERNWPYFARNVMYPQEVSVESCYSGTGGQHNYEQSRSATLHQVDARQLPLTSDTLPLENTYQKQILPNIMLMDNAQVPNSLQHSISNISQNVPHLFHYNHKSRYKTNRATAKHVQLSKSNSVHSIVIENSNLHPTANEFVPNNVKFKRDRFNKKNDQNGAKEKSSYNADMPTLRSKSFTNTSLPDNRYKNEKYYDNRKGINYKQKNSQNTQVSSSFSYRDIHKIHNTRNNKFQNAKYYNRKHQSNVSSAEERKNFGKTLLSTTELSASSKSNNLENGSSTNADKKREEMSTREDYSQNVPLKNGTQRNSNKFNRFTNYSNASNYHKYNSDNVQSEPGAKYKITRYMQKRNNEATNYKEKKLENWRDKIDNTKPYVQEKHLKKKRGIDNDASQRERLTEQLNRGTLECLVCYEHIKQSEHVWSCTNCYYVLHLKCIKRWAKSSQNDNSWKCPACRAVSFLVPEDYFCFCGKKRMPEWNRRDVAHSCGEICDRHLSKNNCTHKCTLLCHPGSCPQCVAMVTKYCGCGKISRMLLCSADQLLCESICGKNLPCGKHTCQRKCHQGECGFCDKTIQQSCFCGENTREIPCRANASDTYSCNNVCNKTLDCGKHYCQKICHLEPCEPCFLTPEKVTMCCCGQTPLTEKRESCSDPVPICEKICSKRLKCGQPSNPHICKTPCHVGECPACDLSTDVKCRCGNMDREIACRDLKSKADDARCEKRCKKKRSCGKHNCNQQCCIDIEHVCPLPCSKTLSCGRHKCQDRCHMGRCLPCWQSSFDELYCECGAEIIYPPVPCGTRRPACNRPCSRQHSCDHEILHNCHSEPTCPPCSVLTQRWCHGKHELRKAVPCHVKEISCGLPCNKPLICGRHKCIAMCHAGLCEKPGQQCVQPCTIIREMCGHICGASCHEGKCPDTPCKEMVKVTCQCGHRSMSRVCADNAREYQRIASNILASKMADMQLGHSVDLEEVFGQGAKKQNQLKTLECNDECKTIERNRKLALGLQIVNPDLSGKLMPRYSDYMKQWAKKDPQFCQMVHEKLTELVQLAKTSKQKSRSYSFDVMNREKRHFVHESCEHFGCESQAYDEEPKRNVVATAMKDRCWLPSYSLLEMVQREKGQRKVPGPVLNTSKENSSTKTVLSLPVKQNQQSTSSSTARSSDKEIDYFDYRE